VYLVVQGANNDMPMSREAEVALQDKWVRMRKAGNAA
jgi:hypothetical protein